MGISPIAANGLWYRIRRTSKRCVALASSLSSWLGDSPMDCMHRALRPPSWSHDLAASWKRQTSCSLKKRSASFSRSTNPIGGPSSSRPSGALETISRNLLQRVSSRLSGASRPGTQCLGYPERRSLPGLDPPGRTRCPLLASFQGGRGTHRRPQGRGQDDQRLLPLRRLSAPPFEVKPKGHPS